MSKQVTASAHVVIERPIADVFAFFADAEHDPLWRSGVVSIKRSGGLGLGTRYEQTVSGPGGRSISANIEVTGFEPDQLLTFVTTSGPVRPHGSYQFDVVPNGTEVRFTLAAELSGIKALAMAGAVQRTMNAEVGALHRAKAYLES